MDNSKTPEAPHLLIGSSFIISAIVLAISLPLASEVGAHLASDITGVEYETLRTGGVLGTITATLLLACVVGLVRRAH